MKLKIKVTLDTQLTLPISYHHILQAVIYNLMGDENGYTELHDNGSHYGKREYKLFTFGPIEGECIVTKNKISFYKTISIEIRAFDEQLLQKIQNKLLSSGIKFGENVYTKIQCLLINEQIKDSIIFIRMLSPICVYTTDRTTKHTRYYNPNEIEFQNLVNSNFIRKYTSIFEKTPEENISIAPAIVTDKDKYLTKYKNFIIEGYKGIYKLTGKPEYLQFLYTAGLGAKNSQGFGMFKVINKSDIELLDIFQTVLN